ncbi:MAG: sigma 54-interacting transcriptional regulator [Myxococcota bacterium]
MHEGDSIITRMLDVSDPRSLRTRAYLLRVAEPGREDVLHRVTALRLSVGTLEANDIVLRDDAVSRMHFEISAEADGFRITDRGSKNGTYVDNMRVFDAYLKGSARIRAGNTQLFFEVLDEEAEQPLAPADSFGPLVGSSKAMRSMYALLEQVAPTALTVLIQGESGTGKELIAEAIHSASPRAGGPFVVFDCSAVPATLIESELFGHEKGAFTGADQRRTGCMEDADGGTLFLDEIGELPLDLQPKLLRAVEKREIRPLGGTKTKQVDVRLIAATNRDLSGEVNSGAFRADLYYRLAVMQVRVPPLRERLEDLPMLVEHFVMKSVPDRERQQRLLLEFDRDGYARLGERPWRGNVRELRNLVEQSVVFGAAGAIAEGGRPDPIESFEEQTEPTMAADEGSFFFPWNLGGGFLEERKRLLAEFERTFLQRILAASEGNLTKAAQKAALDRSYFKRLLRRYGL